MPSQVKARTEGEEVITYHPSGPLREHAHVPDLGTYKDLYEKSVRNPQEFWMEVAKDFYWESPPAGKALDYNFDITKGKIFVEFMKGAKTNVCYNVVDRNVIEKNLGDKTAYFW